MAFCGANKKSGGTRKALAGRGTTHNGTGRCKHHGGLSPGGKPGNKNRLGTGRYETIFADVLDADELDIMAIAAAKQEIAHVEEEIALTTVREHRMLKRIANLRDAEGGMTLVEESTEVIDSSGETELPSERELSEMQPDQADRAAGVDTGGPVTKVKQKRLGTLGQIQAIEQDLTAVQAHKARLIKQLYEMKNPEQRMKLTHTGPGDGPIAVEVTHGLADAQRNASLAAIFEKLRARPDGQALGVEAEPLDADGGAPA